MIALRRRLLSLVAAAAAIPALSCAALAQSYPTRPITMIIPFEAGGPTDVIGRLLAERMRTTLGQSVIAENSTGAGGTIGVGRLARAAPDGYTIGMGIWSTHVVNGAIYTLQYDLVKYFAPVTLISWELGTVIVCKEGYPCEGFA